MNRQWFKKTRWSGVPFSMDKTSIPVRTGPGTGIRRLQSFGFAFSGLANFWQEELHARIHFACTVLVSVLALYFHIKGAELLALIMVTGLVWIAEVFNTAIERIVDFISPAYHPDAGRIKDLAAGAVLLAAILAFITGAIIFTPKFF